jgi:hypothetical protein
VAQFAVPSVKGNLPEGVATFTFTEVQTADVFSLQQGAPNKLHPIPEPRPVTGPLTGRSELREGLLGQRLFFRFGVFQREARDAD